MSYPVVSANKVIQSRYEAIRAKGESHLLAEMLAFQQGPALMTDAVFLQGHCNGNQFEGQEYVGNHHKMMAREAGVDVTGKVYLSGLAAYPGDPRAWVSGRGDVKKLCEERNWSCEGSVQVKSEPTARAWGNYEVAPDLVEARAVDLLTHGVTNDPEEATHVAREQLSPRPTEIPT